MPALVDNITVGSPFLDRRVKLLPCQRERIYQMHHAEGFGIRELARIFKVDKRRIQFIAYPERHLKNLEDRRARGGSVRYYATSKNTEAMAKHRAHKKDILSKRSK